MVFEGCVLGEYRRCERVVRFIVMEVFVELSEGKKMILVFWDVFVGIVGNDEDFFEWLFNMKRRVFEDG